MRLVYGEVWWRHLLESCVIALAIVAQLASMAYKIAIEKDWIVVVASGNKSLLASTTCCRTQVFMLLLLINVKYQICNYQSLSQYNLRVDSYQNVMSE